jgi:hypothetical protein
MRAMQRENAPWHASRSSTTRPNSSTRPVRITNLGHRKTGRMRSSICLGESLRCGKVEASRRPLVTQHPTSTKKARSGLPAHVRHLVHGRLELCQGWV